MTTQTATNPDNAGHALGRYLEGCRRRLGWLARARILAVGAATVVLLTICLAAATAYLVPSQGWIVAARVLLYAVCAATIIACLVRRVGSRRAARRVERRIPAFDGRLITWLDATGRRRQPALLPQLAELALGIAKRNPPRRAASTWLLLPPLAVLVAAGLVLSFTFNAGPASWRLPAERLWLGDLLADTRPKVVVEPGDTVVPRGADVLVRARGRGFAAAAFDVNASFAGSGHWERAAMMPSSRDDFREFVFVAVNDAVDYYVSAGGRAEDGTAARRITSDRFRIEVADLPVVEGVEVALAYPPWTHLEARVQDHGDVSGIAGTRAGVQIDASAPLDDAYMVVNGRKHGLEGGSGEFTIDASGNWHVAIVHRGQVVQISDEYLIDLIHDQPPEVEFTFPGRDRSATAIEEVALRFSATDDFGVEALTLNFAVNGSAWTQLTNETPPGERETKSNYTIFLEDLAVGEAGRSIRPGDVVSFHAVARDHRQSTKSALYFVDVRAFDRHYRDTGTSGGGGSGAGGREQELSSRQREILSATWNLIQERDTGVRAGTDLRDQVDLIAILQRTLEDQIETLVARTEGRRLSDNSVVEPYVVELTEAAAEMELAAETLISRELDDAVQPEQRALQHLLTAEAGLRDVNVSLSRGSEGDSVSRSLSELFDLETDPEQNRYETPQAPGSGQDAQQEVDEEWQRLTELARRQEELARAQERESAPTTLSRWQLERLQRELDSLRERLANNQGQQRSGGDTPRQQESQRGASRSGGGRLRSGASPDLGATLDELDRAQATIEESLAEGNVGNSEGAADAFRRGGLALREGADQLLQDRRDSLTEGLRDAERRAQALVEDQQGMLQRLQALEEDVLQDVRQGRPYTYRGGEFDAEAETKRRMLRDLERISVRVSDLRQQLARSSEAKPELTRMLDRALDDLTDSRVSEQLELAADYFEIGRPLFIAHRERPVYDALDRLRSRLGQVADRLESTDASAASGPGVADVQTLRRRLGDIGAGGDPQTLRDIADATGRLAEQVLGVEGRLDLAAMRGNYRGLGASEANRERLYRLTLAELDRMEIALGKVDGAPIRAEEPRGEDYDAEDVARYFRHLSSGA